MENAKKVLFFAALSGWREHIGRLCALILGPELLGEDCPHQRQCHNCLFPPAIMVMARRFLPPEGEE